MPALEHLANRDLNSSILEPRSEPPAGARVVVDRRRDRGRRSPTTSRSWGWTDVVVLERARLTDGTTWHAAGLVAQVRGTHALTELSRINAPTVRALRGETGIDTGLRRVGSLTVARTEGRMQELHAAVSIARDAGIDDEVLEPPEVRSCGRPRRSTTSWAATLVPTDGTVNPGDAALALAKGAEGRAARRSCSVATVTGFKRRPGPGDGVVTDAGTIACEAVVLAAGLWTSELARLAGASVVAVSGRARVGDDAGAGGRRVGPAGDARPGRHFYIRHYRGRFLFGAFEPKGKPRAPRDIGDRRLRGVRRGLGPLRAGARRRCGNDCRSWTATPGSRTTCARPRASRPTPTSTSGEFPEVPGLWVAAGFNSQGIIYGPGAGKALAEWIVEGHPTMDLTDVDIARTGRWANDRAVAAREDARDARAALRDALAEPAARPRSRRPAPAAGRPAPRGRRRVRRGGRLGAPAWFVPGATEEPAGATTSTGRRGSRRSREEVRAAREGVALFDLSSYAKFLVQGAKARAGLQRLCASDVDVPVGRVVYTLLCNEQGGIEMDPDRHAPRRPTGISSWRRPCTSAAPRDCSATGFRRRPRSRTRPAVRGAAPGGAEVPRAARQADGRGPVRRGLPVPGARGIEVALGAGVGAPRVYTGELGWELYVPTEFARGLYDAIVEAGAKLGLRHAGAFAFDALRLERGSARGATTWERATTRTRPGWGSRWTWRPTSSATTRWRRRLRAARALAGLREARGPRADALARRVGPARRGTGRARHERRLRLDARRGGRASRGSPATCRPTAP